jgi:cytidylate kinase
MIVAIDGPAGAGKSTVARRLAERLGFRYLDTGAMYRALTWLALKEGLPLGDPEPLGDLARRNPVVFDEVGRVFIAGADVTSAIRQARIDQVVSVVARHHPVREVMRERQRELGLQGNAVIEGRDIGTVVAPDAAVKVFLTASPEERARRRAADLGEPVGAVLEAQRERDLRDQTADRATLEAPNDATPVDTTGLTLDEVIEQVVTLAVEAKEIQA